MKSVFAILELMRPKQWVKNFFVIAPLFFSKKISVTPIVLNVLGAFILFCFFSSSVYLLNDIIDLENDKNHPKKSNRPLAKGVVSAKLVLALSLILLSIAIMGSFFLNKSFLMVGLIYWFINLSYCLYLKHLAIVDVICIAIGFVLRVVAGGIVVKVPSSPWILTTTIFLSLFLGFSKRRGEIALSLASSNQSSRPALKNYSIQLLDQFLVICATASIISYALFALSDYAFKRFGTHNLIYTIPFVIFGIFHYLYLIQFTDFYESPTETLYLDKVLMFNVVLWTISTIIIIYV